MRIFLVCFALLNLTACGVQPNMDKQMSGYMDNAIYQKMLWVEYDSDQKGKRWGNPAFDRNRYHAVYVKPMTIYPAPVPSDRLPLETLHQLRDLGTEILKEKLGETVPLAEAPGPGVLTVESAVTGIVVGEEALKIYHYIPFSLAIQGLKSVAGLRGQEVYVLFEAKIIDSSNGELMAGLLRGIKGKRLRNAYEKLSTEHVDHELGEVLSQASLRMKDALVSIPQATSPVINN